MTITRTFTSGADRFTVATPDFYQLYFEAGDDQLFTTAGTTTAYLGDGNDYARIGGGRASVYGQDGADRIDIRASDAIVNGGAGDDVLNIFNGARIDLAGSSGNDRFNFLGNASAVHLNGGDGNDLFVGYSHTISGSIYGGAGNDRFLDFGNHNGQSVVLRGGTGNDLYRLDADSPAIVDERSGEGVDTVQIAHGVSYTLSANVENLSVLNGVRGEASSLTGNALNNRIAGSAGNETIAGLGGNDVLSGGAGNDGIFGGDGNDRLIGGPGADIMAGGAGADRFVFQSTADTPYDPWLNDIDWITQFDEFDRIDVSAIDANSDLPGVQHFHLVQGEGTTAGNLYLSGDPAGWGWIFIEGHTDNDGVPDVFILITDDDGNGYPPVTVDSFIL